MELLLATVDFRPPVIDFFQLIPILVFGFLVVASLCLELKDEPDDPEQESGNNRPTVVVLGVLSLIGLIGYYSSWPQPFLGSTFNEMLVSDNISRVAGLLITICALLAILAGPDELSRYKNKRGGEFCALIFSASLGMVMMASAGNTMLMFLGLELFSLALYLLCIFLPDRAVCREAGMKYFLLSSAASAVLLYGLALLYGATGTTWLSEMREIQGSPSLGLLLAGTALVLCGLLFKLAIVPFHFWAPDVYEGAPTTVTAFMSVATKIAALSALWRLLEVTNISAMKVALLILFSLSLLSILVGNFMALAQSGVKRMLAYSGVANAGYLLIAPVAGPEMLRPMLFFLATYLVGNVGAFLALSQIEGLRGKSIERQDLKGLFSENPWLGGAFALCLVSLAGLPPAAGFMGKFYLFGQAISTGQLILPVVGITGSLVGAAYYVGTAIAVFTPAVFEAKDEEDDNTFMISSSSGLALAICVAGVLLLGLMPTAFLNWI